MPTRLKDVEEFFERIAKLEAQVEGLMIYQKVQMGILAAILLMGLGALFK